MPDELRDVFICHASEDKKEVVRPLVEACTQAQISCWYDEAEIKWGDSITECVNGGLASSRYVVVVFSSSFISKNWPKRELNAALNKEAATGEVRVLPLIVGTALEQQQILLEFPLLNDKRYLPWSGDLREIVSALLERLGHTNDEPQTNPGTLPLAPGIRIPLPAIKKRFTQRDKDQFLRESFAAVQDYFKAAINELEQHFDEVHADRLDVHSFKFICTIYLRGELASRCKIWLGGFQSTDSIAYHTGDCPIDYDNAYNDLLSVDDDGHTIGLRALGMGLGTVAGGGLMTAVDAAEYLWSRFTENLGQT